MLMPPFRESFNLDKCTLLTTGRNTYFILEPGFQLILQGMDEQDTASLVITVLNETKMVGNIETRVVEEHESVNGKVIEISRNYFAFCSQTGNIFYLGEDVDIYKKGKIVSHSGAWLAGGNNKPGLIMPGDPVPGDKYYQEIAPDIAMDRAEVMSLEETLNTPAGKFSGVLKTKETTPLEPNDKSFKYYAPGIGLIRDEDLRLVKYGFENSMK
jgi:hypothetical protein